MRYQGDLDWSLTMQPIAIRDYYHRAWPGCEVVELDMDRADSLKTAIDIGGADKMIRHADGSVAFLAQRFRRAEYSRYDDFTLRESRPKSGHTTELGKLEKALAGGGFIAGYYSYGHANKEEDGFDRFRIFDYRRFAEMYVSGELPQGQRRKNRDGSATFLAWEFCTWPEELFTLDTTKWCPSCNGTGQGFLETYDKIHKTDICIHEPCRDCDGTGKRGFHY